MLCTSIFAVDPAAEKWLLTFICTLVIDVHILTLCFHRLKGVIKCECRAFNMVFQSKLAKEINRSFDDSLILFKNLKTSKDVANFFQVPERQLLYILYFENPEKEKYKTRNIKIKRGGLRELNIPNNSLNILQYKIKPFLEITYKIKKPVHGFIKDRSILTNAKEHLKSKIILNVDLEDFYGTISFARVRGLFMSKSFDMGQAAATIIAQLTTYKNKLPQGACTSPIISNLIASHLDKNLVRIATKYHATYTRYADDITFSTTKKEFHKNLVNSIGNPISGKTELGDELKYAIENSGFKINYSKLRLQIKSVRQEVTGLTINEFPNVKRKFVRQIRAMIHAYQKFGPELAEKIHFEQFNFKYEPKEYTGKIFINVLLGKVAFLKMIRGKNDAILSNLVKKIENTDIKLPSYLKEIVNMTNQFDVFIGHASEDKNLIAIPLHNEFIINDIPAFIDQAEIKWGNSLTEKINHALANSKYFLAILSESSIEKKWPIREINSAITREINGKQVFLPLIVGDPQIILEKLPLISDKLYIQWNGNPKEIIERFKEL